MRATSGCGPARKSPACGLFIEEGGRGKGGGGRSDADSEWGRCRGQILDSAIPPTPHPSSLTGDVDRVAENAVTGQEGADDAA